VTVTKTVSVGAKVAASIGGYYGTKSGYRLYHHTARLGLSAAVTPAKKGEWVEFQVQKYVKKAWQAVVTTGCATLNAKSEASGALARDPSRNQASVRERDLKILYLERTVAPPPMAPRPVRRRGAGPARPWPR
jgi:hypothetical protein